MLIVAIILVGFATLCFAVKALRPVEGIDLIALGLAFQAGGFVCGIIYLLQKAGTV